MKQCPNCKTELKSRKLGAVEIDECRTCRGTWYDRGELKQAKDLKDPDLNWMDFDIWKHEDQFTADPSDRKCPVCNKGMVAVAYGHTGVTVDFCKACSGTWLEKDEFMKIVEALESELESKSFGQYIIEAVKEGLRIIAGPDPIASEWKDFLTVLRLMQYRLLIENKTLQRTITSVQKSAQ